MAILGQIKLIYQDKLLFILSLSLPLPLPLPLFLVFVFSGIFISPSITYAEQRIKDISNIASVRSNQLIGYGLVVGLNGTGDNANFTIVSFKRMLSNLGIKLPPGVDPKMKNVAAVALSAELPAFAKPGQRIDVTASSLGDSKSLVGGTLLMSPLKGADGRVYALAQGGVIVGGLGVTGKDGSKLIVNVPSVGRIPGGAIVEKQVPTPFSHDDHIVFNLKSPDFTTAKWMADVINQFLGPGSARPLDSTSVWVSAPKDPAQKVMFVAVLENLKVKSAEAPARVIVNSRTGTVVISKNVRVSPAAVTHGNLIVTIEETTKVSQPGALSGGETVTVPESEINAEQQNNPMFVFSPGPTLKDIVRAVNEVGVGPGDLIEILEALQAAGALHAELVVI
ncbi:Basal body P-ring protein (plasmid) [Piscirickettsia salmonis]|uniref:flagellar basal body P-ring protein FlgI n=1 Tax=Piscirickettsia salmonis TaxID=1238 RepID=UPI0012B6B2B6|nr:flagellar basal body P-ring protein FlgI [Piscirickettsia salmonis]QGO66952.1 Basal body P-ring protein [Piscirickettsia salmonis]QGO68473.1 Basal body P-ring protein [Piscirickettsia salmonis]